MSINRGLLTAGGLKGAWITFAATCLAVVGLIASSCGDESGACAVSLDCGSSQVCFGAVCTTVECRTNLSCPADSVCDIATGTCAAIECRTDFDCDDRHFPYCVDSRCSENPPPECTGRHQCAVGQICADESCADASPGVDCSDDEGCPNPQVCELDGAETGACIDRCRSHDDCELFEDLRMCDGPSGLCVPVQCYEDAHCADDEACTGANVCEVEMVSCDTLTCTDPERPFETPPIEGQCRCVECLQSNHCSLTNGETCTDNYHCLVCESTATSSDQCPPESPILRDGCCVQCANDANCQSFGLGSICLSGRCISCNCLAGCACPGESQCEPQGDGGGRCVVPLGRIGDDCTIQSACESYLACDYISGQCVAEGVSGSCGAGCPAPSRCAASASGAFCFGCHPGLNECPPGTECNIREGWEDIYDGGECISN